jgi:ankyrin repeat protein
VERLLAVADRRNGKSNLAAGLCFAAAKKGRAHIVALVATRFATEIAALATKQRRQVLRDLCHAPDAECVAELLKHSESARAALSQDALLVGAQEARPDVMHAALSAGAKANENDLILLRAALRSDSPECLSILLSAGFAPEPVSLAEVLHQDKPHAAEMAELLLRARASANHLHPRLGSSLMVAVARSNRKAAQLLLARDADVGAVAHMQIHERRRVSVLSCALPHLDEEGNGNGCMALLVDALIAGERRKAAAVVDAVTRGDATEAVRMLPAARASMRDLAVVEAARIGNARVLTALLRAGCSANAALPEKECSALSMAVRCGHIECARLLLHAGADLTFADMCNSSVLASALLREEEGESQGGGGPMFRLLLEARHKLPRPYYDSLDGGAIVAALMTHKPSALSALLGAPVPDAGAGVWKEFRSAALLSVLPTAVDAPHKLRAVLSLTDVRGLESSLPGILQPQPVHEALGKTRSLEAYYKVDRVANPLALCMAWIAFACKRLQLADLFTAIVRAPSIVRHFAATPDDALLVALALLVEHNAGDNACADEVIKWFTDAPAGFLLPRKMEMLVNGCIVARRNRFLSALLSSRQLPALEPFLSTCINRAMREWKMDAMEMLLDINKGSTMDQMCFGTLSQCCATSNIRGVSLILSRRTVPHNYSLEALVVAALVRVDSAVGIIKLLLQHGADLFRTTVEYRHSIFELLRGRRIRNAESARCISGAVLQAQLAPLLVATAGAMRDARVAGYSACASLAAFARSRFYDPAIWRVAARYLREQ